MENKTSKYFKYAIGEIVLVVIGILIALQINNWNENQKKNRIKQTYIKNLITDFTNDTIQLNENLRINFEYKQNIDSTLNFINNSTPNIDTIYHFIKKSTNSGLRVINNYNDNTFGILISSGNIDLFSNNLTNELMELNRLQKSEKSVSDGNKDYFFETLNTYQSKYYLPNQINNSFLEAYLWKDKNVQDVITQFINMKQQQLHTVNRYIELTTLVLNKTEMILQELKSNTDI
ncbi:MAG: DUF6090 family protein [Polaribacter sp.]|uniref:DUF6090 family protein n=1 Tax=Polaribacter sp. TaxID=1920175 RepID=UPI003BB091D4